MKLSRQNKKPPTERLRQTKTSDSRPAAFSYHASRTGQEFNLGRLQPREQDKRRREKLVRYWRQRIGALVAGITLLICVVYVLQLSSSPNVIPLSSTSAATFLQPSTVYQSAATKLLKKSVFNANKLTVNSLQIEDQLKSQFPELSEVSVVLPLLGHRPIIYVAANTPSLVLQSATQRVLLGDNGKALLYADQIKNLDALKLPVVTDASGLALSVNQTLLPSSSVSFIHTISAEFAQKNIAIESLTLPAGAAYELDVKPQGVGYYVKFNLHSGTALQQAGTYLAVRQRLSTQNLTPAAYIDVRLDGRAYYK